MKEFIFGSFVYRYELIRQKRKTLSLTVTPDLGIQVKCPNQAEPERIEIFLRKKWFWLEKQLCFFKKYQRKVYAREYISGESFMYLGRQYKLVVKSGLKDRVLLTRGRLQVVSTRRASDSRHTKRLLARWYEMKAEKIFSERYEALFLKFDYQKKPTLVIREMQKRWGSFLQSNKLLLNPRLIYTSKECIDYVISHELCHVKYKEHNKLFFRLLEDKYPKWKTTKERLEVLGTWLR